MAKIIVTKTAQRDMQEIHRYINDELCNPLAAQRIMAALRRSILTLECFPDSGRPLDAMLPVHTEYRYLVCENYCIFYQSDGEETDVLRVLHQRRDCMKALFLDQ